VPHFYFATNRWELAFPVEFPLGQLYSNTSYPAGCNFNLRPWMTGHTYQNYAFDALSGRMVQTGHNRHFYLYDPNRADWIGRAEKPKGMQYDSCFYDLTLCTTPKGVVCWTKEGRIFLYQPGKEGGGFGGWTEAKLTGAKLPGAQVDHSTIAYDSRRDRVLIFVKEYGKKPYDGVVWAMDMKTYAVESLTPAGGAGAAAIAWIDRCCYDAGGDVVLMATYLNGAAEPRTPTPAYDCAANRWVGLDLKYAVTKGDGRPRREMPEGHSAGVMYDPKRQLIWGTDTNSQAYVLRLDVKAADPHVLPTPPPVAAE
jgi:hypothetical protein